MRVFFIYFSLQKNELEKPDTSIYSWMEHVSEGFDKKLICAKTKTPAKDKKMLEKSPSHERISNSDGL